MTPGLVRLPVFVAVAVAWLPLSAPPAVADTDSSERLAALVARLGDDDYHRREAAAAELKALGPMAIDALLAAAETSGDLEISLRARWLVEEIPFEMPNDPPEVVKLLARFKRRDFLDRVRAMHRLLRIDDDAGIQPLARVTRLDPSTAGSRIAAALLAREWRADDPSWPEIRRRIEAGLGPSTRPAARFLSALVAFSGTSNQAERTAALTAAATTLDDLRRPIADDTPIAAEGDDELDDARIIVGRTERIFERCHVQMLLAAGRRTDALAAAAAMIGAAAATADDAAAARCMHALVWATEIGLPEVVETVRAVPGIATGRPLMEYAMASAERARGRDVAAAEGRAAAAEACAKADILERVVIATTLARWGCADWAVDAFDRILAEPSLPVAEAAQVAIYYSELLHDLERDDEAARCLRRIFGDDEAAAGRRDRGQPLDFIGRDARAVRSRMHFFEACDLARRGDVAASRAAIERALAVYPKDVDALIGLYTLPDQTTDQRVEAGRRIKTALVQLEEDIHAVPDDPTTYNEYAWLVANTEGDVEKATRFSKVSLVKSFDNPSYLDTLAHCHAAAGRHATAIRTQRLAQRQEPHNRTIRRNLERFEKLTQP